MESVAIASPSVLSSRERVRRYVDRALARLRAQEALRSIAVVLTISAWLLVLFIFADRYLSLAQLGISVWILWGGITALGIPYILWRTYSPRIHENLAAVLADDRLGLHARLCSAMTLDLDDPANAPFSEAFFAEAMFRLNGLKVETAFPIVMPRAMPFLLLPAAIAAGIYLWMPPQDALGLIAGQQKKRKAEEMQQRAGTKLEGKLEDLKKKVDETTDEHSGQYKVNQLIEKADAIAKELKEGKRNPEDAVVALGQLKREIQEEKDKLTQGKEFLERLEQLKADKLNLEEGDLTRDVSEALKMGDAGLAAREMRKLAQKIKQDILNNPDKTDEQKKADLQKLQQEVEKLAGALAEDEALRENLQELSEKVMGAKEYESLQDEIKKQMNRQGKGSGKNADDIAKEMEDVAEELERLEEDNDANLSEDEQDEMEALEEVEEAADEAMEGLDEDNQMGEQAGEQQDGQQGQQGGQQGGKKGKGGKKQAGGGKNMKGKGKKAGAAGQQGGQQGRQGGQGQGQGQDQGKKGGPQGGQGLGEGIGTGHRPYQDGDAVFQKEKVKGKLQSGAITGMSHFRGQGAKGDAPVEFVQALTAAEQEASSSLELERIPNDAREVVKDYFLKVKEGANIQPAAPKAPATFDGTKPDAPANKTESLKE